MTKQKKVIIIGSGLGGLSTGAVLAKMDMMFPCWNRTIRLEDACSVSRVEVLNSRQVCTLLVALHQDRHCTS